MRTNFFLSFIFFVLFSISSNAFESKYITAIDKAVFGTADNVIPKLKITNPYASITSPVYSYKINLKYTRSKLTDLVATGAANKATTIAWDYKLTLVLKIKDAAGNLVNATAPFDLKLSYKDITDPTTSIYEDVFLLDNQFTWLNNPTAELYITAFDASNTPSAPADITLELTQIQTITEVFNPSAVVALNKTADNKIISWDYCTGAQSYDLEWVYIDNYDAVTTFAQNADPFIAKEPVRISTPFQSFSFHNTYSKGKVYFRIRATKVDPVTNLIIAGIWNYNTAVIITNTDDFEGYKNWQASTVFIENGRYKKSITYADGSSRARQSQTSMNSDNTVIISETKYDFEGRPVVNVMPFPYAASTSMNYVANLNTFNVAVPTDHQKSAYDNATKSLTLSTASGASQYYSSLNPFPASAARNYTPDAQGYPYSQVIYTPDNTGRVSRQNTVGAAFRMEAQPTAMQDQHFVQNYYGTPSSTELYRMFGSNVGNALHYTKNYSIDENGVTTIQYLNSEGKVVASALSEKSTTNLESVSDQYNQTALFPDAPKTSIHRLSDQNDIDVAARVSISTDKIINLVKNQSYTFKYDLNSILNAQNGACLTCGYTVEISIIGPDGKSLFTDGATPPSIIPYYKQDLLPIVSGCSTATYSPIELTIPFNLIGEYTVTKKLYYNAAAVKTLNNSVNASVPVQMILDGVPYTNKAAYTAAYVTKKLATANCTFSCSDNCANYRISIQNRINPLTGVKYTAAELDAKEAECNALCGSEATDLQATIDDNRCSSYKLQMLDQLSPEGYYYTKPNWISGIYSSVTFTAVNGVSPTLAVVTDPTKFNSVWAADMLDKHPEYCVYKNLCLVTTFAPILSTRDQYDIYTLGNTDPLTGAKNWTDAESRGFLRPLNMTAPSFTVPGLSSFSLSSVPTTKLDPFFTTNIPDITNSTDFQGVLTDLQTKLTVYFDEAIHQIDYNGNANKTDKLSAWEYASYYYLQGNINSSGSMNMPLPALPSLSEYNVTRWDIFKSIYLAAKDEYIKARLLQKNCDTGNGYQDPTLEQTIIRSQPTTIDRSALQSWAEGQTSDLCSDEICKDRAQAVLYQLQQSCTNLATNLTTSDQDEMLYNLYKYFKKGCSSDNTSMLIWTNVISSDAYLARVAAITTTYGCNLNTVSVSVNSPYTSCQYVAPNPKDNIPNPVLVHHIDLINDYLNVNRNQIATTPILNDPDNTTMCSININTINFTSINSLPSGKANYSNFWSIPVNGNGSTAPLTGIAITQNPSTKNIQVYFKDSNNGLHFSQTSILEKVETLGLNLSSIKQIRNLSAASCPCSSTLTPNLLSFEIQTMNNVVYKDKVGSNVVNGNVLWNSFTQDFRCGAWASADYTVSAIGYQFCQIAVDNPNPCDPLATSTDPLWVPFCLQKEIDKCTTEQSAIATDEANDLWDQQLEAQLQVIMSAHYTKCFSTPFKENFYYETTEPKQLYYTLYYYDQAGNLIQTVPPEGVRLLGKDAFNTKGEYLGVMQPQHGLLTKYKYNSLNQIVYKITPDESGPNRDIPAYTFYNDKGQIVLSQNARQRPTNTFSCVNYDKLGRVSKSYDIVNATLLSDLLDRSKYDQNVINYWNADLFTSANTPTDIVATTYDTPAGTDPAYTNRGRITKVSRALNLTNLNSNNLDSYITYQYDIHGNVKTLTNAMPLSQSIPGEILAFTVDYTYDLLSGSVKQVVLDKGRTSQFIHKYCYDADNRLKSVNTSRNGLVWEEDARYQYYLHGLLARTELGEDRVQGTDHYTTLQGWIKGINTPAGQYPVSIDGKNYNRSGSTDVGGDGAYGINAYVAQDEYMMNLGFYSGDYTPIQTNNILAPLGLGSSDATAGLWSTFNVTGLKGLYNGNIAYWMNDRSRTTSAGAIGRDNAYVFKYDQLDRIRFAYSNSLVYNASTYNYEWNTRDIINPNPAQQNDFNATYDLNGNIKSMQRYDGNATLIDNLSYKYSYQGGGQSGVLLDNKLNQVTDPIDAALVNYDIDGSTNTANYTYDNIGNLIGDVSEQISNIGWNREGKVTSLTRAAGSSKPDFIFKYDVNGKRIYKQIIGKTGGAIDNSKTTYVYYAYDGTGNLMATYDRVAISSAMDIRQVDVSIYGSDRLGTYIHTTPVLRNTTVSTILVSVALNAKVFQRQPGLKQYELKDHLGNVRTVITGIKRGIDTNGDLAADFYIADVAAENDYYPFGMLINGGYRRSSTNTYKFGYNGKPMDTDWNGEGAMYDYGFRIYDPRICKFLSVDPLSPDYPELTPYQFASNTPISCIDLDGLEKFYAADGTLHWQTNNATEIMLVDQSFIDENYGKSVMLSQALNASCSGKILPNGTVVASSSSGWCADWNRMPRDPNVKWNAYGWSKEECDQAALFQLQIASIWLTGGISTYAFGANAAAGGSAIGWRILYNRAINGSISAGTSFFSQWTAKGFDISQVDNADLITNFGSSFIGGNSGEFTKIVFSSAYDWKASTGFQHIFGGGKSVTDFGIDLVHNYAYSTRRFELQSYNSLGKFNFNHMAQSYAVGTWKTYSASKFKNYKFTWPE